MKTVNDGNYSSAKLTAYELELEKIVNKIKQEPSKLRCIELLKTTVGDFGE